jgi:hypothetical protein
MGLQYLCCDAQPGFSNEVARHYAIAECITDMYNGASLLTFYTSGSLRGRVHAGGGCL